jgi:hypothetical protein
MEKNRGEKFRQAARREFEFFPIRRLFARLFESLRFQRAFNFNKKNQAKEKTYNLYVRCSYHQMWFIPGGNRFNEK